MFLWHSKKYNIPNISEERKKVLKKHAQIYDIPISNFELWDLALTHISFVDITDSLSYERLEFLGDSVLGLCIADILFEGYDDLSEGKMSMMKSHLVNEKTLASLGRCLKLLEIVKLGNGERLIDKRAQEKVLCDLFESTLAVIFLHSGLKKCREFVKKIISPQIEDIMKDGVKDFKTKLQKIAIKIFKEYPVYTVIDIEGPDHGKIFIIKGSVSIFEASAKGRSKKEAEQNTAQLILEQMEQSCYQDPNTNLAKEISNNL